MLRNPPSKLPNTIEARREAWEQSYLRGDNHVFQPCEEIVRFVSRYLRKRIDIDTVVDVSGPANGLKILDLGSGIGRNMVYAESMGLCAYGIELSEHAVAKSCQFLMRAGVVSPEQRTLQGDVRHVPWPDNFFDHAWSDSVLDSMPYPVAEQAVAEVARTLRPDGLFYCNFITAVGQHRVDELVVSTQHEKDTIQGYFDYAKILRLLEDRFTILQCELHQICDAHEIPISGRWHVIARLK